MTKRPRRTCDQWQALITEYHASDLSAEAFCQLHDLGRMSFDKWRLRFGRSASVGFTELKSTSPRSSTPASLQSPVVIVLEDIRMELPSETAATRVAELSL